MLTETIQRSIDAIERKRNIQERKKSEEEYRKALLRLEKACEGLQATMNCVEAMDKNGLIDGARITGEMHDDLMECTNNCGQGVHDGTLTADMVTAFKAKSDVYKKHIEGVWKEAASSYSEGTLGYITMIGGLSDNPQYAQSLAESIDQTRNGTLTTSSIKKLVENVGKAKEIVGKFPLNAEIEKFLKKVSDNKATIYDLSPTVLTWIQDKKLQGKLKIKF